MLPGALLVKASWHAEKRLWNLMTSVSPHLQILVLPHKPTPDTFAAIERASLPAVLTNNANLQCERSEGGFFFGGNRQSRKDFFRRKLLWGEAIMRMHYQMMVWANDKVPNPELPSPGRLWDGQWNKVIICVFLLALCQSCQSSISYRDFVLYFRQVDPSDDKAPARTWCSPPSSEMWLCQGQVSEQQMSVSEGSTQQHITLQLSQWEWWYVRKRETVMTWNSDEGNDY